VDSHYNLEPFVGMVIRGSGALVTVHDAAGGEWRCVLRGRLRRMVGNATSPVVVGDRVEVRPVGPGEGAVEKVLPRRSHLTRRQPLGSRRDTGQRGEQVLAANLDLAVTVVAAPPRPTVIDRYLALVRAGGCTALVCVNKIDLVDQDAVEDAVVPYRLAGVPLLLTSALRGDGVDDLRRHIGGKLVAFIGPSGAGKSSLLNALDPALNLRVGALNVAGKGAHTTTWAATYRVADGLVVDTPGPAGDRLPGKRRCGCGGRSVPGDRGAGRGLPLPRLHAHARTALRRESHAGGRGTRRGGLPPVLPACPQRPALRK